MIKLVAKIPMSTLLVVKRKRFFVEYVVELQALTFIMVLKPANAAELFSEDLFYALVGKSKTLMLPRLYF